MSWLTEDPVPIVVIGAAAGVLLVIGYIASRNARFLVAAAAVGVVAVGLIVAERMIVTDSEEVEAAVWRLAEAIENNDLQRVIDGISPAAERLRGLARANLPQVQVTSVNVSGLETEVPGAPAGVGRARFRATVVFSAPGFPNQRTYDAWELTFQREDGGWLLVDAIRRSAVGPERELPLVPGRE